MSNTTLAPSAQQQAILDWIHAHPMPREGRHIIPAHLILEARAGTGKTSTLLMMVREIVREPKGGNVFLGAYNKAIANEIAERLKAEGIDWREAEASTMHSAGFRICRQAFPQVTVDEKKVDNIIASLNSTVAKRNAGTIKQGVSLAKQSGLYLPSSTPAPTQAEAWSALFDHFGLNDVFEADSVADVIALCDEVMQKSIALDHTTIDFDDMVHAPLMHQMRVRYPYDWVMVDESQDTNYTRQLLAFKLRAYSGRMVAVGDSHQAIYGFTGADNLAMENIKQALLARGDEVTTLPLTVTYRCPKSVVQEANKYVKDIVAHADAPLGRVERATLQETKTDVWYQIGKESASDGGEPIRWHLASTDVILCRNKAPLVKLAYCLIRHRIPCRVEGRDIGVGLKKLAQRWSVKTLEQLRQRLEVYLERERAKWTLKGREEMVDAVEDKVNTLVVLMDICNDRKQNDVESLYLLIDEMFSDSQSGALRRILTLSTIHKSKGREFSRVFILNASKYLPSKYAVKDWQKEQEKNLAYVAVTRAKETLIYLEWKGDA